MNRLVVLIAATSWITGLIDHYGVLAVFLFTLVENFGAPIPGETMIVIASAYAASGHLNIVLVALCCIAGVWLGSTLSYLAGKRGGVALMRRLHVPERHLLRAQEHMTRWGGHTVMLGRYVAFLRSYIGWLAGLNHMETAPFLLWNFSGAVIWTLTFCALGYILGHNLSLIERVIKTLGYGAAAIVVAGVVLFLLYRYLSRRRHARHGAQVTGHAATEAASETTLAGGNHQS